MSPSSIWYDSEIIDAKRNPDWSLSNFKDFLVATSLISSEPLLTEVAPLLYRMIIALGSFPYHNHPFDHLTIDVLSVGLAMIRCKQDEQRYLIDSPFEEGMQQQWLDSVHRRLIFQSIANHDAHRTISDEKVQRTNEDDEDLLQVLAYLSQHNYIDVLGNPKEVTKGPEPPDAHEVPSSRWKMLGTPIPIEELEVIIRFLVTTQLSEFGISSEQFTNPVAEVEVVSRHISNAFTGTRNDQSTKDVDWTTFNNVIENEFVIFKPQSFVNLAKYDQPTLFKGLRRLIVPFQKADAALLERQKAKFSSSEALP